MQALLPYLRGEQHGKVVGLTFDDGYRNNLSVLPILQRYGFSATCYLVSDLIGKHNIWDEQKNIPFNPLMSTDEVRQWLAAGMSIGAHTRHHVDLRAMDDARAGEEIAGCKAQLEALFDVSVDDFCYPYGYYTPRDVSLVESAGYQTATTTRRSRTYVGEDKLLELPRVTINNNAYLHTFLLKILSGYEDKRGR
ncbi:polysaccharide deacetylase family protein [Cardiobacteriaceae bacterium TAE3-ERU3]|nr:polysaccharide deacetylase family protein [Cardiobacteriaceae bacterium TAE3-ERU3]